MWEGDQYCPDCGQKVYHGPLRLRQLFAQFFEVIFNIDNRFFRTLRDMFFPGRLTNYYLAGKQQTYLNPLRLFFVTALVFVAILTFTISYLTSEELNKNDRRQVANAYHELYADELRQAADSVKQDYLNNDGVHSAIDSLLNIVAVNEHDSTSVGYFKYEGGLSFTPTELIVSSKDIYTNNATTLCKQYNVPGRIEQYQVQQLVKIMTSGANTLTYILSQSLWALLIMIPITGLLLKLVYIRRKRRYVEHLVFSLHTHAVLFILLGFGLLYLYFQESMNVFFIGLGLFAIFLYLALRKVYQQGWFKTLVKLCILGFFYAMLLNLAIVIAIFGSLAFF